MTWTRNLAWQNLDLAYRSSIAYQFARFGLGLKYSSLPAEVVHQAKRSLLDGLGCAIGSYSAPGRPARPWQRSWGGRRRPPCSAPDFAPAH